MRYNSYEYSTQNTEMMMELRKVRANYAMIIKKLSPLRDSVRGYADLSGTGISAFSRSKI